MKVSVVGGSGYVGGELLRLLLHHPEVRLAQATSDRLAGRLLGAAHPNLRGVTDQRFCKLDDLEDCDAVFLAVPHGASAALVPALEAKAGIIIDLSADFRLSDPAAYRRYYAREHPDPQALAHFVTGCPEYNAKAVAHSDRIAVPGCMAGAAMLALRPLADAGIVENRVRVDARTGSSGAGRSGGPADQHAERSGAMRVFAPAGHRHEAEIRQFTGFDVMMTATGVEAVRGVQVLAHTRLREPLDAAGVRAIYRDAYADAPFVRLVAHNKGAHRLPDPRVLLGSNFCDVGFAVSADGRDLVAIAALDNLVKGAGGNGVQCLNLRAGWAETTGLAFPGLYPL